MLPAHEDFGSEKSSEKIIRIISEEPELLAKEIAERVGISARAVEKNISKLKEQGIIERIGPDKGGFWKIINK